MKRRDRDKHWGWNDQGDEEEEDQSVVFATVLHDIQRETGDSNKADIYMPVM